MILVLSYRFCESQDSLIGYRLCQILLEKGYDLYATTTAEGGQVHKEQEAARQLNAKGRGKVTLVEPVYEELEKPSSDWIAKLHRAYFTQLQKLKDVDIIIGTLPGTTKTAVDLKNILGCKLVLLARTKIGGEEEDLKNEINKLAPEADEIWSVGSDIYDHYQDIFREVHSTLAKHRQVMIKPQANNDNQLYWNWNSKFQTLNAGIRKLVTVWKSGYQFFYKGKETHAKDSNKDNYSTLFQALGEIGKSDLLQNIKYTLWNIHGLENKDDITQTLRGQLNAVQLNALKSVETLDDLTWKNCLAYLSPDVQEESFNFIALTAIWFGIPTLVSNQSTVGKFLLSLNCPSAKRALVNLTGNAGEDKKEWIEKNSHNINILNREARSIQWAKELSEYLQKHTELWALDFTALGTLSEANLIGFTGSQEGTVDDTSKSFQASTQAPVIKQSLLPTISPSRTGLASASDLVTEQLSKLNERISPEKATSSTNDIATTTKDLNSASRIPVLSGGAVFESRPPTNSCPHHPSYSLNFFCENPCGQSACLECKTHLHRDHQVIFMVQKANQVKKKLQSIQEETTTEKDMLFKKKEVLMKGQEDVETSIQKATEQMRQQLNEVDTLLSQIYSKQKTIIEDAKRKQLRKFREEIDKLEKLIQQRTNHCEKIRQVLMQPAGASFLQQANILLLHDSPQRVNITEETETWWKKTLYKRPFLDNEEISIHLENKILGYFRVDAPSQLRPVSDEVTDPAQSERTSKISAVATSPTAPSSAGSPSYATRLSFAAGSSAWSNISGQTGVGEQSADGRNTLGYDFPVIRKSCFEFQSLIHAKKFENTHLKSIFDGFLKDDSAWVCGWSKNVIGKNDTVFLRIRGIQHTVLLKKKKRDENADVQTMITPFGKYILFARKDAKQVYGLNTLSGNFKQMFNINDLRTAGICCGKSYIYVIGKENPEYIRVLDSNFYHTCNIATTIEDSKLNNLDMAIIPGTIQRQQQQPQQKQQQQQPEEGNDFIVISKGVPGGFVRVLSKTGGVVWQLNDEVTPRFKGNFDPCSVSASTNGDIYIAERSTSMIYFVSAADKTKTVRILLGPEEGIRNPTRMSVDSGGKQLLVIHRDGDQIRHYVLKDLNTSEA